MGSLTNIFVAAALILSPVPATAATLLGANVTEEYRYPDLATPYDPMTYAPQFFVVGAGQESTISLEGVTTFGVDFSAALLDILFDTTLSNPTLLSSDFNGFGIYEQRVQPSHWRHRPRFNQLSGLRFEPNISGC